VAVGSSCKTNFSSSEPCEIKVPQDTTKVEIY
jgi:hypothetical protein